MASEKPESNLGQRFYNLSTQRKQTCLFIIRNNLMRIILNNSNNHTFLIFCNIIIICVFPSAMENLLRIKRTKYLTKYEIKLVDKLTIEQKE